MAKSKKEAAKNDVQEKVGPVKMISVDDLTPHKFHRKFFSPMDKDKFNELVQDIKDNGVKVPLLVTPDNQVVAGRERLKAAKRAKIEQVPCIIEKFETEEDLAFRLVADNINRRHLTKTELVKVGKELEKSMKEKGEVQSPGRPKKGKKADGDKKGGGKKKGSKKKGKKYVETGGTAAEKAAQALGVSASSYSLSKQIVDKCPDEVIKRHDAGDIPQQLAQKIAQLPEDAKDEAAKYAKNTKDKKELKKRLNALVKESAGKPDPDVVANTAVKRFESVLDFVDKELSAVYSDLNKARRSEVVQSFRLVQKRVLKMREAAGESVAKKKKK